MPRPCDGVFICIQKKFTTEGTEFRREKYCSLFFDVSVYSVVYAFDFKIWYMKWSSLMKQQLK